MNLSAHRSGGGDRRDYSRVHGLFDRSLSIHLGPGKPDNDHSAPFLFPEADASHDAIFGNVVCKPINQNFTHSKRLDQVGFFAHSFAPPPHCRARDQGMSGTRHKTSTKTLLRYHAVVPPRNLYHRVSFINFRISQCAALHFDTIAKSSRDSRCDMLRHNQLRVHS